MIWMKAKENYVDWKIFQLWKRPPSGSYKANQGLKLALAICKQNICPNLNVPMKQLNETRYLKYCERFSRF